MECNNHNLEFVRRYNSIGGKMLYKQCLQCGESHFKMYKLSEVNNFDMLPKYSFEKYDEYQNIKINEYRLVQKELRYQNKLLWYTDASEYYKSEKWKLKTKKVLKRDNYLCQCCLERQAVQVHHTTYEHYRNEPLFELISICVICHEAITKLDNTEQ
jgi:5-methylcytosine-specific restriction endonuclease McrA